MTFLSSFASVDAQSLLYLLLHGTIYKNKYIATSISLCNMSDCSHWEVVRKFSTFLLHIVFEQGFSCSIIWEREVEFFLGEWFHKFLIHFPRLIGWSNNSYSIFFFEHFLFIFSKNFTQFGKVWPSCATCTFLFLLLSFEDLLDLIHIDNCRRECFCYIESHCKHFIKLFFIIYLWL